MAKKIVVAILTILLYGLGSGAGAGAAAPPVPATPPSVGTTNTLTNPGGIFGPPPTPAVPATPPAASAPAPSPPSPFPAPYQSQIPLVPETRPVLPSTGGTHP
jgi:hypothetical protein